MGLGVRLLRRTGIIDQLSKGRLPPRCLPLTVRLWIIRLDRVAATRVEIGRAGGIRSRYAITGRYTRFFRRKRAVVSLTQF